MKQFILSMVLILIGIPTLGQNSQTIFDWKPNAEVATKKAFLPLTIYNTGTIDPHDIVYDFKTYTLSSKQGDAYTLKLQGVNEPISHVDLGYDGFSILYHGKPILTYYTGDPLYHTKYITMGKSKDSFIQVPLDDKSFALCFGGWLCGIDNAPEMVIVVVSEGKAKVVFDNYAYTYNYTPPPAFSIEYIDNIEDLVEEGVDFPTPAMLKKRTKHRIWKEGNVLKYQSWK